MNISTRLMLGLGFVVMLLVLLGTAGQVGLASMSDAVDALMREDYSAVQAVGEMARAVDQQDAAAFASVLGDTTGYAAKREAAAAERYANARGATGGAVGSLSKDQADALRDVDEAKRRYDEALTSLRGRPRDAELVNAYYGTVEPAYLKLSSSISELGKRAQARGGDAGSAALRVAWRTRAWAGVITAFVFAASIWTATHLYRTVVWPLTEMARTARAMTHGEVNRRFRSGGRDELGELAALLNSLADRLFSNERLADQRDVAHEQILESVLDRWGEGLAVIDRTGRILAANAVFRRVLGSADRGAAAPVLTLDDGLDAKRETLLFRGKREFGELVRLRPPKPATPDAEAGAGKATGDS